VLTALRQTAQIVRSNDVEETLIFLKFLDAIAPNEIARIERADVQTAYEKSINPWVVRAVLEVSHPAVGIYGRPCAFLGRRAARGWCAGLGLTRSVFFFFLLAGPSSHSIALIFDLTPLAGRSIIFATIHFWSGGR